MPLHSFLVEHPRIVAAQQNAHAAKQVGVRANANYASAVANWEKVAVDALTAGQDPPVRPEPPTAAVLAELGNRERAAAQLVEKTKAAHADEIEAACREREAELLAEVEKYRARLDEIAVEGMSLAHTVEHLDRATGAHLPYGRRPLTGDLDAPGVLKHTATGQGWIGKGQN